MAIDINNMKRCIKETMNIIPTPNTKKEIHVEKNGQNSIKISITRGYELLESIELTEAETRRLIKQLITSW